MNRFRRFPYNFHDADLVDFRVGPGPEVSIRVGLCPIYNQRQVRIVTVCFGAIRNMDAVALFFADIARPTEADRPID